MTFAKVKPINHLASRLDRQQQSIERLPSSLLNHLNELTSLTKSIKTSLAGCLPDDIMQTLTVGGYHDQTLTLAVASQTAVNHLIYQRSSLLHILTKDVVTFRELKRINVVLNSSPNLLTQPKNLNVQTKNDVNVKSYADKGLSPKTRATISHVAECVIVHERLKTALFHLAET